MVTEDLFSFDSVMGLPSLWQEQNKETFTLNHMFSAASEFGPRKNFVSQKAKSESGSEGLI